MANLVRILFKQDTVLKQSPVEASTLPSNKRQKIPVGTLLVLQSYADPSANKNHFRLSLKDVAFHGLSTNWYAFAEHAEITNQPLSTVQTVNDLVSKQQAKDVVTVSAPGGFLKLVFNVDTVIKRAPVAAELLSKSSMQEIPAGTELVLLTSKPDVNKNIKFSLKDSHIKFSLKDVEFNGFNQDWYVFIKHVGIQRLG